MSKRLLTLDDLYSYYSANFAKGVHFNAKENNNNPIIVQVNGNLKFENSDSDIEGLLPVTLQSCHIDKNLNGSTIKREAMESALPSFKNRPILGYIHEVDGQLEFYSHNMRVDDDDNIVYDEIPIGVIPESCDAKLEYDEDKGKTYAVVNGYIFEEYTQAAEILRREQECPVSVELSIRELSYDAKDKVLDIENFFFSGVTILGKTPEGKDVKPGMDGANIKLADFSAENNSMFSSIDTNQKLIDTLEKLNETLLKFNIDDESKEGGQKMDKKFEELLEKYGKTAEDVDFDYEEMTEEELEAKFEELFGENQEDTSSDDEASDPESDENESDQGEGSDDEGDDSESKDKFSKASIEFNGKTYTFELSLDEIQCALYELVNATYGETDNTWYGVEVYESYLIMIDYWSNSAYKQTYKQDGDNFSLTGDRVLVHSRWLTEEEEATLDEMKANYSAIETELNVYKKAEEDAEKDKIFADESYVQFLETEEFKSLMKDKDNYSVDELKDKAAIAFAECVKKQGTFSVEHKEQKTTRRQFASTKKEKAKNPYGRIFDRKK